MSILWRTNKLSTIKVELMKIIDLNEFNELKRGGHIEATNVKFVDSFKMLLHIDKEVFAAPKQLEFGSDFDYSNWEKLCLENTILTPDKFYLAKTIQTLKLPKNVMGTIHTRSAASKCGIDVIQSSHYVSPSFGRDGALPLTLELSVKVKVKIHHLTPIAGLILFTLDKEIKNYDREEFKGI